MKNRTLRRVLLGFALTLLAGATSAAQHAISGRASFVTVSDGSVSFEVSTNVFGTMVRGKSNALRGGALVRADADQLRLEQLDASVPVESLKTGIKLRDQHMRKYIFRTGDGQLPDVRFTADTAECSSTDKATVYRCVAPGALIVRGTSRPFALTLDVEPDGSAYRARGSGTVTLSAYGIARPSQFGVRTEDAVTIQFEFSARTASTTVTRRP